MSTCGNVSRLDCSNAGCRVSITVSLGHILVSASAGCGELNAADWRFVLLIVYPPMELFLACLLALWATTSRVVHFGSHGLLAGVAHRKLDAAFRF